MPHLENWSVVGVPKDEYEPPELWALCLHGIVSGHPRLSDGRDPIVTSRIVHAEGGFVTTKSGNIYTLGEVDPDYEKAYPDARNRLFETCKCAG